jgi:hypothetical protein
LFNSLAWLGIGILAYRLARIIGQQEPASLALAFTACLWPPSLAYSSVPLKDSFFIFAAFCVIASLYELGQRTPTGPLKEAGLYLGLGAGSYLLGVIRPDFVKINLALVLLFALSSLGWAFWRKDSGGIRRATFAILMTVLASFLVVQFSPVKFTKIHLAPPPLKQPGAARASVHKPNEPPAAALRYGQIKNGIINQLLDRRLEYASSGGLSLTPEAHSAPVTIGNWVLLVFTGFKDFLIEPLPWRQLPSRGGLLSLAVAAMGLLWILLLPGVLWGCVSLCRKKPLEGCYIILWGLGLGLAMAFVIVNFGTLYRQRDIFLLPLLLCFSMVPYQKALHLLQRLGLNIGAVVALTCFLMMAILLLGRICASTATPIFSALEARNKKQVEQLLEDDPGQNSTTYIGRTPLHLAVVNQNYYLAEMLLKKGANVDAADAYGNTPLHLAALLGRPYVAILLKYYGADPNRANCFGATPLHYAAYGGRVHTARALLQAGADSGLKEDGGNTALDLAISRGKTNVVLLLRQQLKKNQHVNR